MIGRIAIHISSKGATSPLRAPFGSFEFFQSVTKPQLFFFLKNILLELEKWKVKEITIRNFPDLYHTSLSQKIASVARDWGFSIHTEVDSIIPVTRYSFERIIKISERQKLRKSRQVFTFSQTKPKKFKQIYLFIKQCRTERRQSLSMTYPALKRVMNVFPDRFYFFEVGNESETAAAAIVIQVNPEVLYTFYYAHSSRFNRISPTVMLLAGIYDFAKQRGVKKIDLGTSMLDGRVNRNLFHFKRSVGGVSNDRLIFKKFLS